MLSSQLLSQTSAAVFGLDIHRAYLELAQSHQAADYIQGDAHYLPFGGESFDITLCHFTLLWLENPFQALLEMKRVTKNGGRFRVGTGRARLRRTH